MRNNKKRIGKIRGALNGAIIKEYALFPAKTYFVLTAGKIKGKGVKKRVMKYDISHQHSKGSLFNKKNFFY